MAEDEAARQNRINNFYPDHLKLGPDGLPTEEEIDKFYMDWGCCKSPLPNCCKQLQFPSILEPQSKFRDFTSDVWLMPTDINWTTDYFKDHIIVVDVATNYEYMFKLMMKHCLTFS